MPLTLRRAPRSTRTPRLVPIAAGLALVSALAACGTDATPAFEAAERLDAVTISGEPGAAPTLEWKEKMAATTPEVDVTTTGDGAALADGDQVYLDLLVGDGFTQETVVDTFDGDDAPAQVTIGTAGQPGTLAAAVAEFVATELPDGTTRGSRVVITAGADEVFGDAVFAEPIVAAGIGNKDGLVIVADVLDYTPLEKPMGVTQPAPAWAPKITYTKGKPSGLDFTGIPKPSDTLLKALLVKGEGEPVAKNDQLTVNYLGAVYQGDEPFDESFSRGPFNTTIGTGAVIKGWDRALVGVPVGSRVMLQIPPDLGYGESGQGESIPPNSTLYFVIDILGAL